MNKIIKIITWFKLLFTKTYMSVDLSNDKDYECRTYYKILDGITYIIKSEIINQNPYHTFFNNKI